MSGVCSAGFATTALPAASAPAICPVKMASGKFQGEIADEHAASVQRQLVQLSGRALQHARSGKLAARFRRCIAEMVDRLAEIALRVAEGLAGLPHHQRHEPRTLGLEQIGGAVENGGARLAAQQRPNRALAALAAVSARSMAGCRRSGRRRPRPCRSCGEVIQLTSPPSSISRPETMGLAAAGVRQRLLAWTAARVRAPWARTAGGRGCSAAPA